MAKVNKSKKNKKELVEDLSGSPSEYKSLYWDIVDQVEKEVGLDSGLEVIPKMSTGLLAKDLMLGGGYPVGSMIINVGLEQSGKTTDGFTALGQAIENNVPIKQIFDAENALDPRYANNILAATTKIKDIAALMGERDMKTGKWIRRPAWSYYDSNIFEEVFGTIHKTLSAIPNKRYKKGEWWLVFDKTREQQALMKAMGLKSDSSLSTPKASWCSIGDDDSAQAFFLMDSLNSLVTAAVDDEEESGNAVALEARALGKWLRRIRGKMRRKGGIFLAINQLRSVPMARYGPTETETGGNAPKQYSDIRIKYSSRVPPQGSFFERDKESPNLCVEPSVWIPGGFDHYAFKAMHNIKNKFGTPFRKTGGRVWVSDANGKAYGFDPVYDTFRFFEMLGGIERVRGKKGGFTINIGDDSLKGLRDRIWTWDEFKICVLGEVLGYRELKDLAEKKSLPRIAMRKRSFALVKSGKAEELYQLALRKGVASDEDEE